MLYQDSLPEASAPPSDCNSCNCSICYIGFRRRLEKALLEVKCTIIPVRG